MVDSLINNLTLALDSETVKEEIKVEVKTDVQSDSVGKILGVTARVMGLSSKISDGEIVSEGKVNLQICYYSDGEIKKTECYADFKGNKPISCQFASDVVTSALIYKEEADLSGIKLLVSAVVALNHTVRCLKETPIKTFNEDLVCNTKPVKLVKCYGTKKTVYPIEEEFELDFEVKEVLSQSATCALTAVQCGVGTVIADGEIFLSAMLLQSGDKRVIIKNEKVIPLRAELEFEGAMPENTAISNAIVRSFKTDVQVDGETGKSTVNASVILDFSSQVFAEEEKELVVDAFSTEKEVDVVREEFSCSYPLYMRSITTDICEKATLYNLKESSEIVCVTGEKIEIISSSQVADTVSITGVISLLLIFKQEQEYYSQRLQVPFEKSLLIGEVNCQNLECNACFRNVSVSLNGEEAEINSEVVFGIKLFKKDTCKHVIGIELKNEKVKETAAISVYIAEDGETLFGLAKRLNVSPEVIKATNKELEFPLDKKERIVVYRKL